MKDVRELEKMLEAEQLDGQYPSSSAYSRNCEYRELSPKREKAHPDPHRPATVLDVRTASITNIIVGSFVWWFLSYVLYNWLILRVFIYACWAYNLFLSVRDLIYASDAAERNKEFNAKLDEELCQKETKKREDTNASLLKKVNVCHQDQEPSIPSASQKYDTQDSYTNWKRDINGKLYPPDTVWVSPNSKVYHCYDICRNSIISSRVDKIIGSIY